MKHYLALITQGFNISLITLNLLLANRFNLICNGTMKKQTPLFTWVLLVLAIQFTPSCSTTPEEPKEWEPQLDQFFLGSKGELTFGRTHYAIAPRASMNQLRENQIASFMKKTCKTKKPQIIRKYQTESDFVSLKYDYTKNLAIKVFEFNCRP